LPPSSFIRLTPYPIAPTIATKIIACIISSGIALLLLFGSNIFPFELSKQIKNSTLAARKNKDRDANTQSNAFSPTLPHVSFNDFDIFAYAVASMHSHKTCKKESRNDGTTKSSKATSQLRPHRRSAGILLFCSVISRNRRRLLLLKHHRGDVHPLNPLNPPRRRTDRGKEKQFGREEIAFFSSRVCCPRDEKVKPKKGEKRFLIFFDFWLLFLHEKQKTLLLFSSQSSPNNNKKGGLDFFHSQKKKRRKSSGGREDRDDDDDAVRRLLLCFDEISFVSFCAMLFRYFICVSLQIFKNQTNHKFKSLILSNSGALATHHQAVGLRPPLFPSSSQRNNNGEGFTTTKFWGRRQKRKAMMRVEAAAASSSSKNFIDKENETQGQNKDKQVRTFYTFNPGRRWRCSRSMSE